MAFINCVLYALGIGIFSFLLGRILPKSCFFPNRFPFKSWYWEKNGTIYNELFQIKRWQAKVPDMSKIFPGLMPRKKVTANFQASLPLMIQETCVAELTHVILCLLALPCLWIWPAWGGVIFSVLYILGNIPFIMIQRYNRPRLMRIEKKQTKIRKDG